MKINVRLYLSISIQTYCVTNTLLTNSEILRKLTPKCYIILCQSRPTPIIEKKCVLMVISISLSVFYVKVFHQVYPETFCASSTISDRSHKCAIYLSRFPSMFVLQKHFKCTFDRYTSKV